MRKAELYVKYVNWPNFSNFVVVCLFVLLLFESGYFKKAAQIFNSHVRAFKE